MNMLMHLFVVAAVGFALANAQGCVYRKDKLGNKVECSADKLCPSGLDYCDIPIAGKTGFCCLGCPWNQEGAQAQADAAGVARSWWTACIPGRNFCIPDWETCHYPYDDVNDKQLGVCCWNPIERGCVYRKDKLGNKVECSVDKLCPSGYDYCDNPIGKSGFCCLGCPWNQEEAQAQADAAGVSRSWWRACLPDRDFCHIGYEKCHYPYDDVNDKQLGICCWIPWQRNV